MKNYVLIVISLLFFFGCSEKQTREFLLIEKPVPNARLYAYKQKTIETTSSMTVIRDAGVGCHAAFYINGTLSAILALNERTTFYLAPGKYSLKLGYDPSGGGLCNCPFATMTEITFGDKEHKAFLLKIVEKEILVIHQVTDEDRKELKKTKSNVSY
jgi:hypothetical protein